MQAQAVAVVGRKEDQSSKVFQKIDRMKYQRYQHSKPPFEVTSKMQWIASKPSVIRDARHSTRPVGSRIYTAISMTHLGSILTLL
jgi:hypothetical protein